MALPTAYLTSLKNVEGILNAIQSAKAPPKFTNRFLQELGFKGNPDRLMINMLKALGFLTGDGAPTARYFEFLDQSQSGRVLAEAVEEAYADLYQVHREAHKLSRAELKGKLKTMTQGQASDSVVDKMVATFLTFANLADFDAPKPGQQSGSVPEGENGLRGGETTDEGGAGGDDDRGIPGGGVAGDLSGGDGTPIGQPGLRLGGLVYNIELHLPDTRDPAVYEALFRSLKTHLLS